MDTLIKEVKYWGLQNQEKDSMFEISENILDFMINRNIITNNHTGKINLEINVNQGGITDVKLIPELRFK